MIKSLAFLLCLCVLYVHVSAQSWPSTRVGSYQSLVAANFHNPSDNNYYTLSYREYYDATNNRLRAEGRFHAWDVVEIVYLSSNLVYRFPKSNPSNCTVYNLNQSPMRNMARQSVAMFDQLANYTRTYVGRTDEARGISANKWTVSHSTLRRGVNVSYTADVYFAIGDQINGIDTVPIRVDLRGWSQTPFNPAGHMFAHTYDWVNFVAGEQPASLFQLDSACQVGKPGMPIALPRNNSIEGPAATMAPLPSKFYATLEVKMNNDTVYTTRWYLDTPNRKARFDHFERTNPDAFNNPVKITSSIYDYTANTYWGTSGSVTAATMNTGASVYSGCSTQALTDANKSPLVKLRAGSVPLMFSQPSFMSNAHTYHGRRFARGVMADVWRGNHSVNANGGVFNFVSDIYFFPIGWQFATRPAITRDTQIPMRIVNTGNFTANGVTTPYSDIWDLFLLNPDAATTADFVGATIGCEAPTPSPVSPSPSDDSSSRAAAGGAIGAILGLLALGAGCYFYRKRNSYSFGHSDGKSSQMSDIPAMRLHDNDI